MIRQNYQIESYPKSTRQATTRYKDVFDTGKCSGYTKSSLIPRELQYLISPHASLLSVREVSNRIVMLVGTITLVVNVGNRTSANVTFTVAKRPRADVIVRCNFCIARVETSYPRQKIVKRIDSTEVLITNDLSKCLPNLAPILKEQEFFNLPGHASRKIWVKKTIALQSHSRNWVPVSAPQAGFLQFKSHRQLYESRQYSASRSYRATTRLQRHDC